jgi:hypothetical protein
MSKTQVSKTKSAPALKAKPVRRAAAVKQRHNEARVDGTAGGDRVSKPAGRVSAGSTIRTESKQAAVLEMLRQPKGATIDAIVEATRWQKHSVLGLLSAVVRKKLGLSLKAEKMNGERRYRIEEPAPEKPSASQSRRAKTTAQHVA